MRRDRPWLGAILIVLVLSACGNQGTRPGTTPTPSGSVFPTPISATVIVVAVSPQGPGGPTALHLVRLDGSEATQLTVKAGAEVTAARGSRIFIQEQGGVLKALHRDGTVEDLGNLGAGVGGPLVVGPDGNQWLWSTTDTTFKSTVYIATKGQAPKVVEQMTDSARVVRPYSWTFRGPYVELGANGIGGYIPFYTASGPVDLVETTIPKFTPVNYTTDCSFSDWADDGTLACFKQGALTLRSSANTVMSVHLDATRFHLAGDAYFTQNVYHLIVGGATGAGTNGQPEQYTTALVNPSDGSVHLLALDGVRPAVGADSVYPDGSVIAWRPGGAAGGAPGVFFVSATGKVTQLFSGDARPIGVLTG